jgi:hypothetical protein
MTATVGSMLKIRELTDASGALAAVFLGMTNGALVLVRGDDVVALPARALEAVMARYGAPFDPEASITVAGTLDLGDGRSVRHVRHLAGYDVIARDYLVYEGPGTASLCAMATTVARGLEHLADVVARGPTRSPP